MYGVEYCLGTSEKHQFCHSCECRNPLFKTKYFLQNTCFDSFSECPLKQFFSNIMMKIYFTGSITGGRGDVELYKKTIDHLKFLGEVLTEYVGDNRITSLGEVGKIDQEIYARDLNWLIVSDVVVADVSVPSLGVGFEIAKAIELNKKVLCLYRVQKGKRLSPLIAGCSNVQVVKYQTFNEIKQIIDNFFKFNSF